MIKNYQFNLKELVFLVGLVFILGYFVFFSQGFSFLSLFFFFLFLLLWKIISGLSWFNFFSLFVGMINLTISSFWLEKWLGGILALIFLLIFFKKYTSPPSDLLWREFLLVYLFWFWTMNAYSLYFLAEQPFLYSLIFYAVGLISFLPFYFLFRYEIFSLAREKTKIIFLLLILFNLEIFWLLSFFSLPFVLLSTLDILIFYSLFYYQSLFRVYKKIAKAQ